MGNKTVYLDRRVEYSLKAPAKINIGLRVLSKRQDGFHNIETIFYPVNLSDNIRILIIPSGNKNHITVRTRPDINLKQEENICHKAADLFLSKFVRKKNYRVNITVRKNIPLGAGLGGGSSDAAAVIKTLCKYFKIEPSLRSVISLASSVGSDVPFFLNCKPSYASGRGDKLLHLPGFRVDYQILIIYPGINISTKNAYRMLNITARKHKTLNEIKKFDPNDQRFLVNDFEKIIFKQYPEIEMIKYYMLKYGAVFSLMSGSGSTVFGFYPKNTEHIKMAAEYFRKLKYETFIV